MLSPYWEGADPSCSTRSSADACGDAWPLPEPRRWPFDGSRRHQGDRGVAAGQALRPDDAARRRRRCPPSRP